MNNTKTVSLLLAGLLAGGTALAQTAAATSDVPVKAGEASTVTQGRPNMVPAPQAAAAPVTSATGTVVNAAPAPTMVMGAPSAGRMVPDARATATSNVPNRAGEVSTMTGGVPNMSTQNPTTDAVLVLPSPQHVQPTPHQAGEASTMVGGRPNADPMDPRFKR